MKELTSSNTQTHKHTTQHHTEHHRRHHHTPPHTTTTHHHHPPPHTEDRQVLGRWRSAFRHVVVAQDGGEHGCPEHAPAHVVLPRPVLRGGHHPIRHTAPERRCRALWSAGDLLGTITCATVTAVTTVTTKLTSPPLPPLSPLSSLSPLSPLSPS